MIAVVPAGGSNLASVLDALGRLKVSPTLTRDPAEIRAADRVILPGVGAARDAMERLETQSLARAIRSLTQPTLGICLGMQILFQESDEGNATCLGIIPGRVRRMEPGPGIRIPHMGWNAVRSAGEGTPLLEGIPEGSHFYFVHGYAAPPGPWVRAETEHGVAVPAIVQKNNFHGVQFHPEKSADVGARLLENFLNLED